MQAVKVRGVAGEVKRRDLPLAACDDLGGAGQPLGHDAAPGRLVALARDVLVRPHPDGLNRDGADSGNLLFRQDQGGCKLGKERMRMFRRQEPAPR